MIHTKPSKLIIQLLEIQTFQLLNAGAYFHSNLDICRTIEQDYCPYQLGQSYNCIEPLEPLEGCALFLSLAFIGRHIEMGKGHFEDDIGDPELVVLGDLDNVGVPANYQGKGEKNANDHMDDGIDLGCCKVRKASGLSSFVLQ